MFCASDNATHSLPSPVDHRLALDRVRVHALYLACARCQVIMYRLCPVPAAGSACESTNRASAVRRSTCAALLMASLEGKSPVLPCMVMWLACSIARLQCSPCSTRACAGPHVAPRMCAHAPCAHVDTLGHRGEPLAPCMTPMAERALRGHHGVPDWMAVRCAFIMRLMVASSGITTRVGYGMRASAQVFHDRHLLPTDEFGDCDNASSRLYMSD